MKNIFKRKEKLKNRTIGFKNGDVRIVEQHGEFCIEHYSEAWGDEDAHWGCRLGNWGFKTLEEAQEYYREEQSPKIHSV